LVYFIDIKQIIAQNSQNMYNIFMNLPSGKQIRAARNLLGYSADALAQRVGASAHQVYRVERRQPRSLAVRLTAELEARGIRFVNGGVILQDSNGQRS